MPRSLTADTAEASEPAVTCSVSTYTPTPGVASTPSTSYARSAAAAPPPASAPDSPTTVPATSVCRIRSPTVQVYPGHDLRVAEAGDRERGDHRRGGERRGGRDRRRFDKPRR